MKILSIDITNTRQLECFQLTTEGGNIEVAGATGEGKTTAISCLWEIMKSHPDSLKHGTKKAEIKVKVGEGDKFIIATRKITKKTSTITLKDQDGENFSIGEFKNMLSSLSVNPHKIMDMKPMEQVNTLLKAADLEGFDIQEVDSSISALEDTRLDLHRDVERLKVGDTPEKVEKVVITDLLAELDKANERNVKIKERKTMLQGLEDDRDSLDDSISDCIGQLENLEQEMTSIKETLEDETLKRETLSERIKKGTEVCSKLKDVPTDPINAKIKDAEGINEKALLYTTWETKSKEYDGAKESHTKVVEEIKALRESKEDALDNAKWPLEGLSIEDGAILYDGCLLSNLGESEQMLVCAALAIEDIKAHPLKVVRMDGVESMSKKDFIKLQGLFNDNGIQVLSTRVSRGEIEEGEIEIVEGKYTEV